MFTVHEAIECEQGTNLASFEVKFSHSSSKFIIKLFSFQEKKKFKNHYKTLRKFQKFDRIKFIILG